MWRDRTPAAASKLVVTAPEDGAAPIAEVVSFLQANGYTRFDDPRRAGTAVSAETRAVVFTPAAFRAQDAAQLRAMYDRGVVIAALDVGLPDLRARLDPELQATANDGTTWIRPSTSYVIYSVIRRARIRGVRISQVSDVLRSPSALTSAIDRALAFESERTPPAIAPTIPTRTQN